MHSSSVGQGCSSRSRSKPANSRAATIASCRRHAPLASPISASSGPVTAWTAATRSRSSSGAPPSFSWKWWIPPARSRSTKACISAGGPSGTATYSGTAVLERAAEERRDGLAGRAAEDVPARDVDRALRVFVAAQGRVHPLVDRREVRGVDADERRRQLAQRGPRALAEPRQVGAPERAGLPEPLEPATRPDPDDRARQDVDDAPGRHHVVAVGVRQVVAVDVDPVDDGRAVAHRACPPALGCDGAPRGPSGV